MVEHVPRGEEENADDGEGGPEVSNELLVTVYLAMQPEYFLSICLLSLGIF